VVTAVSSRPSTAQKRLASEPQSRALIPPVVEAAATVTQPAFPRLDPNAWPNTSAAAAPITTAEATIPSMRLSRGPSGTPARCHWPSIGMAQA